ncbi:MAG: molybdopterin-dependent oxidoreductase [Firmicutes bacterium]|nr:molybdopterin-dependent oxidoreductase [Bacillota bacterium]
MKDNLNQIGKSFPIQDAALKVTGALRYTADLKHPNELQAKMLLSPHAHARVISLDTTEAEALPGVVFIAHTFNAPERAFNGQHKYVGHKIIEDEYLFPRIVRFVGDRVASVAAETAEIAAKAVKLIKVEYEVLPAVLSIDEAIKPDAPDINGNQNLQFEMESNTGDFDQAINKCHKVYEATYTFPALHHAMMENQAVSASIEPDGLLTVWAPDQNSIAHKVITSEIFNIPMHMIKCITPALGGGFGNRTDYNNIGVPIFLTLMTGRPVKLRYNRRENIIGTNTRQGAKATIKVGVDKDGHIVGQALNMITNTGAYATCGGPIILGAMSAKYYKMIKCPNMKFKGSSIYTNNPTGGAMRGYGSPQVFGTVCGIYNEIAKDLNMDITDFYEKNLVDPDGIEQRKKTSLGNPRPKDAMHKGMEMFNWDKKPIREVREDGRYLYGKGMSVACHGNGIFGVGRDMTACTLRLNEDGTALLSVCTHEMGSGCVISLKQIVAEILGLEVDEVRSIHGNTDVGGWSNGESASRGLFVEGGAAYKVALQMKQRIAKYAADYLRVKEDTLVFGNKEVSTTQLNCKPIKYIDLVSYVHEKYQEDFIEACTYASVALPGSYGAHFADVLVDTVTGKVKVLDYVAVHDVGKVINPMILEGQLEGGIHMGLGYALSEEITFDEKGKVTSDNFKKYHILHANEMPNIKTAFIEEGEYGGPYGAKSIGEAATVPVASAVLNAISNAIGKQIHQSPAKPERVLALLKD